MSLIRAPQPDIWSQLSRLLEGFITAWEQKKREEERLGAIWEIIVNQSADVALQSGLPEDQALARAKEYAEQIARERGISLPPDFEQRIRVRLKVAPRPSVRPEVLQTVQGAIRTVRQRIFAGALKEEQAVDEVVRLAASVLQSTGVPVPPNLREVAAAYWGVESGVSEKKISQWFPESSYSWMKAVPQHVKDIRVASEEEAWKVVGPWMDRIAEVLQKRIESGTATPDDVGMYAELRKHLGALYPAPKTEEVKVETRTEAPLTPETPAARVAREYGAPRTYTTTETETFQVTGLEGQKRETLEEYLYRTKQEDLIPVIREYNPNLLRVPLANEAIRQRVQQEVQKAVTAWQRRPITLADAVHAILAGTMSATEADRRAAEALLAHAAAGRVNLNTAVPRGEALSRIRSLAAILSAGEKTVGKVQEASDAFRNFVTSNREAFSKMLASPGGPEAVRSILQQEARRLGIEDRSLLEWAWKYVTSYRAGEEAEERTRRATSDVESRRRRGEESEVRLASVLGKIGDEPRGVETLLRQKIDSELSALSKVPTTGQKASESLEKRRRLLEEAKVLLDSGRYQDALAKLGEYVRSAGITASVLKTGITQEFLKSVSTALSSYKKTWDTVRTNIMNYLVYGRGVPSGQAARDANRFATFLLLSPEDIKARLYDPSGKPIPEQVRNLEESLNELSRAVPFLPTAYASWWNAVRSILQEAKSNLGRK